ncbi:MAG: hypothetical protein HYV04_09310, partial [Deltaproteobacteria bacterium]|nr:hypothetical protein [Deltaproteobacteria bacterium]
PNRGVLRTLSDAVQQLADDVGLELADEFPEETGSWWKRVILRTKDAASHDEGRERLVKAERALEVTYLDKPQAEANKNQADAASSLINALAKTSHACIQVGSLLIVKATKADGESCVVARTLTPRELKKLEENQAILRRPEEILEWLGRSDSDMMVESDATKRLTSG